MPEVELLDKSEVWVDGVRLSAADLGEVAAAAARTLGIDHDRVFVTDVRDGRVTFDVLVPRLDLAQVAGRATELLAALRAVAGVQVLDEASVHSAGVLGVIAAPADSVPEILERAEELDEGLRAWVATRVAVVSTGAELVAGEVRDTNLRAVEDVLGAAGFDVRPGGTVPDDERVIAGRVARLVGDGFGLVVTTGGVGAEDKDRTVEALSLLDPDLATSTLATFSAGSGRHVKEHVRIAVATVGWATVVALPGPTREVRVALPALLDGLAAGARKDVLADAVGEAIRGATRTAHAGHS